MLDHWLGLTEADVMLHAGTMNWTYTLGVGITDPWAVGATAVLYNGPRDPAVWPRADRAATARRCSPPSRASTARSSNTAISARTTCRACATAARRARRSRRNCSTPGPQATGKPLYEALGMSEISTYVSSGPTIPVRARLARQAAARPAGGDPAEWRASPSRSPSGETGLLAVHRSEPGADARLLEPPRGGGGGDARRLVRRAATSPASTRTATSGSRAATTT